MQIYFLCSCIFANCIQFQHVPWSSKIPWYCSRFCLCIVSPCYPTLFLFCWQLIGVSVFLFYSLFFKGMRMCYLKFNATVSSIRVCQCDRSVFYLRYDLCGRTVHFWLLWSLTLFFLLTWFMAAGLTLAPLLVKVDPNLNVILTACLTVYVGCYRSVKPTPPSVSTAGIDAPQPFLPFVPF